MNEQRRLQAVPPIQQAQDAGRPPTRFSTVGQVANALSISKMTVYRLIDTGALPAYRFGHSFRIPTQAVWDYIRGNKIDPDGVDRATAL